MNRKSFVTLMICLVGAMLIAGCGGDRKETTATDAPDATGIVREENSEDKASDSKKAEDAPSKKEKKKGRSLAQRMAGKYSYHYSDEEGNDEFFIMDVVPFGDNLYAFCGQAMPEDYESLNAYSFWASEFIPYDRDEITGTDNDTVSVNELCFSVMSNVGKYLDAGHKGTITLTDDGLVFEGFENEGFLVPENDDSRLFLKDDRVEDTFGYLKHEPDGGDEDLQGLWILDNKGADTYLEFTGSDLYIYRKAPDAEVFFVAGGCEYSDGSFEYTASRLGYGGQPIEMSCEYKVTDDTLKLKTDSSDFSRIIPKNAAFSRIRDGKVHVITMDEVELDSESLGMHGQGTDIGELTSRDYYGVFVSSAKEEEKLETVIQKLEDAGFNESCIVYTPDFDGLNPEPYYVATTGMYTSESDAKEALSQVKAAGFTDAYVKQAGKYTNDRFWYTMHGSEIIDVLSDGVMLRGVSLIIPYRTQGDEITADLFVPKDAVFDKAVEGFSNYEKGETPYEWIIKNYDLMKEDTDRYLMNGPALSGVFEVGIRDNKVTTYYGSYWWD